VPVDIVTLSLSPPLFSLSRSLSPPLSVIFGQKLLHVAGKGSLGNDLETHTQIQNFRKRLLLFYQKLLYSDDGFLLLLLLGSASWEERYNKDHQDEKVSHE
jgi:hypothetical protein